MNRRVVLAVARFWRKHHVGKRILGTYHPGDSDVGEFLPPDEDFMSEAQLSFLRGVLKWVSGFLALKGIIDVGDAGALQVVLESLLSAGVGAYAFWASHQKHKA